MPASMSTLTIDQVAQMAFKEITRAKAEMIKAGIPEETAARFICDALNQAAFVAGTSPMKQ